MGYDPFGDDPFANPPPVQGRRIGGLLKGLSGHVSPAHVEHLQQIGRNVVDRAVDFAADNPDKMEKIGERVGMAAGAGMVSPIVGGKAGKKAGGRLGGLLSRKAQEKKSSGGYQPSQLSQPSPSDWDPFGDNVTDRDG